MNAVRLPALFAGLALAVAAPAHANPEVEALAAAAAGVVIAAAASDRLVGEEPEQIVLEAGRFDAVKDVQPATSFGTEYRAKASVLWKLRPFAGAGFTSDRSVYAYGGLRLATRWGEHVVITPNFAVGGYRRGEGKDLGDPPLIGRFGLDFEYALDDGVRIGLAYHHMSNGKVLDQAENPGTEIVGVTVSAALR